MFIGTNRGACKVCGGMGHLTKQCKNHLSTFYNKGDGSAGSGELGLPLVREDSEISSLSSDVSSDGSDGEVSSGADHSTRKKSGKGRKRYDWYDFFVATTRHQQNIEQGHASVRFLCFGFLSS